MVIETELNVDYGNRVCIVGKIRKVNVFFNF